MRALLDLGLAAIASAPRPGAWTVASLTVGAAGLGLAAIHWDDEIAALPRVHLERPTDIYDLQDIHRALATREPGHVAWANVVEPMKTFLESVYPASAPDAPVGEARQKLAARVLSGDAEAFAVFLDYVMEHYPSLGEALLFDAKGVEALVCTPPNDEPEFYPSHVYWLNPPEDVKVDLREHPLRSVVQAAVLTRVLGGPSPHPRQELEWSNPMGEDHNPWLRMQLPAPKKKSRARKRKG